jgi:hypothetical protein
MQSKEEALNNSEREVQILRDELAKKDQEIVE